MTSFKVVFIGAGGVNFGTPRAPWNHSARLEAFTPSPFSPPQKSDFRVLGNRLKVLAIIDPVRPRAQAVLDNKLAGPGADAYKATVLFNDTAEYIGEEPDVLFIGTPPALRGTMTAGRDVEIVASKKFASSALFVEKPVSSAYPLDVQPLNAYFRQTGTFVAVGYMLRYLKGVRDYSTMD
jgi:predicted dehydrogenase